MLGVSFVGFPAEYRIFEGEDPNHPGLGYSSYAKYLGNACPSLRPIPVFTVVCVKQDDDYVSYNRCKIAHPMISDPEGPN